MRLFRMIRMLKILAGGESGTTLIEILAALAIMGVIIPAFLTGLVTTSRAAIITDEQATADSLAVSQMEWVKNESYSANATEYSPAPIPGSDDYAGYSVVIAAEPLHDPDDGIQRIAVTVKHSDKEIITLEGYKVDR